MVVYSVVFRYFTFSIPAKNVPAALRYLSSKVIPASDGTESTHCIARAFHMIFGRKGFFGIEGKHFVTLFLLQEVVQTILRASQASKLATFVPREGVVRAYVALVVAQCLSIPVFRRIRQTSPGLERLLYIMSDVLLGFVTTIPTVLALPYAQQYDMQSRNFPIPLYEGSEWYASVLSEFQRNLIGSWFDLFTRIIMSMSILISLDDSKVLLYPTSRCKDIKHIVRVENSESQSENTSGTVVVPWRKRYAHRIMKMLIAGVGTAIMIFHVRTEVLGHHDGCILPVRPWTSSKPGCAFMLLNCETMEIQGSEVEVTAVLSRIDPKSLQALNIVSCPHLPMPQILREFSHLSTLRMFGSKVEEWGTDAALTATEHPHMSAVAMIRVEMPNRTVPLGLMSPDFPPNLRTIHLRSTNVKTLPSTLSRIWPVGMIFMYEFNNATQVPEVIFEMSYFVLSLAGNLLTEFPTEGLYLSLMHLDLSGNPLTTLPETPATLTERFGLPGVVAIDLSSTNLQALPSWCAGRPTWFMGAHTPLCSRILVGESSSVAVDCYTWDGVGMGQAT
ncbi:hypothetical protein Poli38472_000360 [Pythium oligandrum]|uniref:Uncharacterized protein n=1 Tax=Pythium oligandrum TaxID=41045 RepID=A0A8K1CC67_PYTOL|nr:hypothetical protein Poli38472_000360 [Pythium oligandrum]|eukprot:TMW60318.1 hypothetical protein Poli38472_000360 [Pythium oligandrum]